MNIAKQTHGFLSLSFFLSARESPCNFPSDNVDQEDSLREIFLRVFRHESDVRSVGINIGTMHISPAFRKISQRADISGLTHTSTTGDKCQCVYAFAVIRYMISVEHFSLSYTIFGQTCTDCSNLDV